MRYRVLIEAQLYVDADSEREAQEKALKLVDPDDVSVDPIPAGELLLESPQ